MHCSCSGETLVVETRTVDGIIRRRRRCRECEHTFWTKEIFDREVGRPGKLITPKKQVYTKPEAAAVHKKKVETRRKVEDIKREKKLRVPSYFIEDEEDY